jgi:hypothetical protein
VEGGLVFGLEFKFAGTEIGILNLQNRGQRIRSLISGVELFIYNSKVIVFIFCKVIELYSILVVNFCLGLRSAEDLWGLIISIESRA